MQAFLRSSEETRKREGVQSVHVPCTTSLINPYHSTTFYIAVDWTLLSFSLFITRNAMWIRVCVAHTFFRSRLYAENECRRGIWFIVCVFAEMVCDLAETGLSTGEETRMTAVPQRMKASTLVPDNCQLSGRKRAALPRSADQFFHYGFKHERHFSRVCTPFCLLW